MKFSPFGDAPLPGTPTGIRLLQLARTLLLKNRERGIDDELTGALVRAIDLHWQSPDDPEAARIAGVIGQEFDLDDREDALLTRQSDIEKQVAALRAQSDSLRASLEYRGIEFAETKGGAS